jgi:methyltransferase (TIGR00027 family)
MARRPPAAQTAFGPMFVTAVEQHTPPEHRIVTAPLAARVLPAAQRLAAHTGRWSRVRDLGEKASDRKAFGVWGGVLCRKRYARDQVRQALAAGVGQVVLLGAGLDTLACELAAPVGVPAFEVDMPENIAYKRGRLRSIFGGVPDGVHLVPVRFETGDLAGSLAAQGYRADVSTIFVWEAVTQYLTEDDVRRTLAFLAKAAAGSRLILTFVRRDFFDGADLYGAESLHRRFVGGGVWHFALDPPEVTGLLGEYDWAEREQVGPSEYTARYLRPAGRDLTVSEIERFVYADKP